MRFVSCEGDLGDNEGCKLEHCVGFSTAHWFLYGFAGREVYLSFTTGNIRVTVRGVQF